jgi:NAD(P)-dependent dehydrogenase (short-subunit alcohol dehydrogenase family)
MSYRPGTCSREPLEVPVPVALVTGGSRGFGQALAQQLDARGWQLILDGRDAATLRAAVAAFPNGRVTPIVGDVADPAHRVDLLAAVRRHGRLDLLVNNASLLGGSPLPTLAELSPSTFEQVLRTNVVAPVALVRACLPLLRASGGAVVSLSSDAAVEAYEGWGGYGASKAALDHATAVLAVEEPHIGAYAFDPGDLRTAMHQAAFPGHDISDRPLPETVVPALLHLLDTRPPSGRYRAADLLVGTGGRA